MAIYAIGDVQGCFDELMQLIEQISFNPEKDLLWFVGDIVNRGPNSLETLRWVKSQGNSAVVVLGNHDLHLLAAYTGAKQLKESSSLHKVLQAKDVKDLIDWLRHRSVMHYDADLNIAMVHAGLVPQWNILEARNRAVEVEKILRSDDYKEFLQHMYGNKPDLWQDSLEGWERLRMIINIFTRIRYCDNKGVVEFNEKGPPGTQAENLKPWFQIKKRKSQETKIIFGHWSTLGHYSFDNVIATDTGCIWGGALTAVRIDNHKNQKFQVACEAKQVISESTKIPSVN